ncbi:MAG: 23S rRNA (adenine(2503)-C(2))-methyltransferase RlmN, partial [Clostridia bacterium]|nr:23S rRNA (adenine(2503)-C(2))-methyltransferase RlmN [Clostridia bacterium]
DEKRSEIMPINNKWNISALLSACRAYYERCGRRISFEYTLISGKNDSIDDATALGRLLKNAFRGTDAPIHVNLIRVNEVKESGFSVGSEQSVRNFCDKLNSLGISATVRRRLGSDINAACGQLRRSAKNKQTDGQ